MRNMCLMRVNLPRFDQEVSHNSAKTTVSTQHEIQLTVM